jgi:hypothetical protein
MNNQDKNSNKICNGKRPTLPIYDELKYLKGMYTSEQIINMFEDCKPKNIDFSDKHIIIGTDK